MSESTTVQKWICESAGSSTTPTTATPTAGSRRDRVRDIPDTWFCPVCGARKRDFWAYED